MTSQAPSYKLDFSAGTDISNAATQFLDVVRTLMQVVLNQPSDDRAESEHALLTALYREFFAYAGAWAMIEKEKSSGGGDHPSALQFKNKAAEVLGDTEKNIIAYAHAYMRLQRSAGFIKKAIGEYEEKVGGGKNITWTSDTGILLGRYRKEREGLKSSNEKLTQGLKLAAPLEKSLATLETETGKVFGKEGEDCLRGMRSALRQAEFEKARKNFKNLLACKKKFGAKGEQDIKKAGAALIDGMEKNKEFLQGMDGKMFMRADEIAVVIKAQEKEIEQKNAYLSKYHQPYMEYKLRGIGLLKDKLLVVGSLDSLTTLYIRLIRGMAQPIRDIKEVRLYEEEVLNHVLYLLSGQFKETANIEEWNAKTMQEFIEATTDFAKNTSAA